jgi:hypothetical protein
MTYQTIPPSGGSQEAAAAAWAAKISAFVVTKDATLTKTSWLASCASMNEFDRGAITNTGSAEMVAVPGKNFLKMRVASGTTANSFRVIRNRNYAATGGVGAFNNLCVNARTSHWALATRVIVQAVNATCSLYGLNMTDEATTDDILGVLGATSQTNFTLKIGTAAAQDTGVAIGALGAVEHDLIAVCDGTTLSAYIDLATAAVASGASNTGPNAAGHFSSLGANGATASNASMDILYAVAFSA